MKTLTQVLSRVQQDLGDIAFERLQRAEYIDTINDIIYELSTELRIWVQQTRIIPFSAVITLEYPDEATMLLDTTQANKTEAVVLETNERWRYYDGAWESYPYTSVKIDPDVARIWKFLDVKRNGFTAYEQSFQSARHGAQTGYNYPQDGNNTRRDGYRFSALRRSDNGMDLTFDREFDLGEEVIVSYLLEQPYQPLVWLETTTFPEVIVQALRNGVVQALSTRLWQQGDDKQEKRMQAAQKAYASSLARAKAYLKNLKDENTATVVEPFMWLSENKR